MKKKEYAIITGSTKGIGKAIALHLALSGHHVIINYSSDDMAAKALEQEFTEKGITAYSIIKKDLSSPENVISFVEECLNIHPVYDSLILNTGITDKTPFPQVEYDQFVKVMETNLMLPFLLVQQLRDAIIDNGSILFIGSSLGTYPHATSLSYGVSKAGLESLAKNLVKEFASRKIRVNIIAPGFVDTEWQKTKPAEIRASIEGKIALGRFSTPEEIADIALSILNNQYMNGALIPVDGGYNFR